MKSKVIALIVIIIVIICLFFAFQKRNDGSNQETSNIYQESISNQEESYDAITEITNQESPTTESITDTEEFIPLEIEEDMEIEIEESEGEAGG